ncbi:hypothetical protein WME79_19760 [Sorangium sp. So ce726]|uniref:hypothetical protein n=1 Tax=Sorangium sp. So ce726 TaxID=3133319 RepID=UPI003F5E9CBD
MPKDVTFFRLTVDPECPQCSCVDKRAVVDCNNAFARRTSGKELKESDFLSWWDLGRRPATKPEQSRYCKDVCGYKGVSVHLYTDHDELMKHYRTTKAFKPKATPYYCIVKLTPSAGKVASTPSSGDPLHHDILKADNFNVGHLILIDSGDISECLDTAAGDTCLH